MSPMDAQAVISAMIANLIDARPEMTAEQKAGYFDAVQHAVSVARGWESELAGEWLAEEIQERIAAQV